MVPRTIALGSRIRVQRREGIRHPSLSNPKTGLPLNVSQLILIKILGLQHLKYNFNFVHAIFLFNLPTSSSDHF